MTGADIFAIVCSVLAALSATVAIITFFVNRGKDKYNKGTDDGNLRGDIKYIRNGFDDLRLDVKEVARNQNALGERLAHVEESAKQAHKRIDTLEKEINHTEG